MKNDDKIYIDKVRGCWLGKCIGGNIGAPYEGMKQRMKLCYSPVFLEKMLPNDDLDLQILWLDVLKEKGLAVTAADLAQAFAENCDYAPGEYAFFKKNFRKGIMPPLSGKFNNEYFNEGMGAPIRSEIWACLFPGDPQKAAEYAAMDASVDHAEGGESACAEVFLAALESLCFTGGQLDELIQDALSYIPDCRIKSAVRDVAKWCKHLDMDRVLDKIIQNYGHSESAMAHQNIAIIVAALLLYGDNFTDAVMAAVNCGFDTDCTGATVGSILGILHGCASVENICSVTAEGMQYKLGVRSPRTDFTVAALSEEVAELRRRLSDSPVANRSFEVVQTGIPAIGFGEKVPITLEIRAPMNQSGAEVELKMLPPVRLSQSRFTVDLTPDCKITVFAEVSDGETVLPEALPGEVYINGERVGSFGLSGKRRYMVYGPYWKNIVSVPPLKPGESYWGHIPGSGDEFMDILRNFHISALPDTDVELETAEREGKYCVTDETEDVIRLSKSTGFRGNSVYFFKTAFYVPDDIEVAMQIGRNTPVKVWLNGELIAEKDGNEMFYHETIHKLKLPLKKGENRLAFRIIKNNEDTRFSYEFLSDGVCSDHVMFSIINPIKEVERA